MTQSRSGSREIQRAFAGARVGRRKRRGAEMIENRRIGDRGGDCHVRLAGRPGVADTHEQVTPDLVSAAELNEGRVLPFLRRLQSAILVVEQEL